MDASISEDVRACIEVGKELNHISRLIEKDTRKDHYYKEESKQTSLVNGPYVWKRGHAYVHKWPWVQSDWSKSMMKMIKSKCKAIADCVCCACVPHARSRLGSSWRQVVVTGGMFIGMVVVSIGIWYFRYDQPITIAS